MGTTFLAQGADIQTVADNPLFKTDIGLIIMGGGIALVAVLILISFVKSILHLCPPNEVLVFSGRKYKTADGSYRGYRLLIGGRGYRVPVIERVHRMNLGLLEVPINVKSAYSKGGVPLNVEAIANVKISSDERIIGNAIERFLGRDTSEIRRVAKETLEGHLRGVLARLTPEEVNEDRLKFGDELSRESETDLNKLGIHVDTLKIQHVSDEQRYLDSIGREAIANVVKSAEIAESDARRDAELSEADNEARANITKAQVEANIAQMTNELRTVLAQLDSDIKSEEEVTLAAARETRAKAEQELQQIRSELEGIRLKADQVLPAEAQKRAQEFQARGNAALVRERGAATAQTLAMMDEAWKESKGGAMTLYLIDDIENIIRTASKGVHKLKLENINVIDSGDGDSLTKTMSVYPNLMKLVFNSVESVTGINIAKVVSGDKKEESK